MTNTRWTRVLTLKKALLLLNKSTYPRGFTMSLERARWFIEQGLVPDTRVDKSKHFQLTESQVFLLVRLFRSWDRHQGRPWKFRMWQLRKTAAWIRKLW